MNTAVGLSGTTLSVTDGAGAKTADLSSLDQSGDISGLDSRITNDSTALETHVAADGDLSSTNGTWINGERISMPSPLKDGDLIQIGYITVLYLA